MHDLNQIFDEMAELEESGTPYAVATVVKVEGSSYRRPGARMLVTGAGETTGAISGGCLEAEVRQQACEFLSRGGGPAVLTFEEDLDDELGYGTGCGGTVHVLVEPRPEADTVTPFELLQLCFDDRRNAVLATVSAVPEGRRELLGRHLLMMQSGEAAGALLDAGLDEEVKRDASEVLKQLRSRIVQYDVEGQVVEVLLEVIRPPVHLVVFGTGYDVAPVAALGAMLHWKVTVVGAKPPNVLAERFPEAQRHLFLMHPERVREYVTFDERTATVIMNHVLVRDRALLLALLDSEVPYIGMLGPHARTQRMLDSFAEVGQAFDRRRLDALHAPVGLDLASETPEEIALSIVGEVQAVLHQREGGLMRKRQGPIHEVVPIT